MYFRYILGVAMKLIRQRAMQLFFLPGDLVADLVGATEDDDRMMIRTLINILFWNIVVVIGAVVIFR
jgi:hypothetical protein